MARNLKKMTKDIFHKIQSAALLDDPNFPEDQHKRWITRKSDEDADLMARAKVKSLPLGMKVFVASIEYGDEKYFCFSGMSEPEELPPGLESVNITPGLFSCVVTEANISAVATAAQVRSVIEGEHDGIPGYVGHSLDSIVGLFPLLSFFRVSNNSDEFYFSKIERVAGSYFSRGYQGYPLPLSITTRDKITNIFESGPDTIPYHLPLEGLLSYNWPAFFLDLYRCLEQLYSVPKLEGLIEKIKHEGTLADLAYILEECISWRPREEESLSILLNHISQSSREGIVAAICRGNSQLPEASANKCAAQIYKLRNSHVHFRPAIKADKFDNQKWDEIIGAMCIAVSDVYSEFGEKFLTNKINNHINELAREG